MSQSVRTAVDPQALGAACTLKVAGLLVEAKRLTEARELYQRILTRYSSSKWVYYVDQAKHELVNISDSAPAVLALRSDRALSH